MASIYEEYGIPTKVGESMMKIISYIAIESPDIAREAVHMPPELVDLVDHFDIIWTTSMEKSYVKRRKWDRIMALREFIQNALDAEHESFGYDNIDIKTYFTDKVPPGKLTGIDALIGNNTRSFVIEDRGPGITYKAFTLGGEDKKCYLRGAYGEGMKVAALYMSVHENDVFIFSGDIVYKCYVSEINNMLTVSIGRSTSHINGTKVLIHNLHIWKHELEDLIYHPNDSSIKRKSTCFYDTSGCKHDMPNTVIESDEGKPNKLYVRDMFVTDMDKVDPTYFYGYNLWWVDLEPNRTNVSRSQQLLNEVSRTLCNVDPYFIVNMIEKNMQYIQSPPHYIIPSNVYEIWQCSFAKMRSDTIDEIRKLCANNSIGAYTITGDNRDVVEANHEGITPIVVPTNFGVLLHRILPTVADVLIETHKKLSKVDQIPLDQLTASQLSTYSEWAMLMHQVMRGYRDRKHNLSIVVNGGDRSFYTPSTNTISMSLNRVENSEYSTFIHELSHALDYSYNYTSADMTESFEESLADVGSFILETMSNLRVVACKSRCSNLCFNASIAKHKSDFFENEDTFDTFTSSVLNDIFNCPTCIYVSMYHNGHKYIYTVSCILNKIDPESMPRETEEIYNMDIDKAISIIIDMIHSVLDDTSVYTSIIEGDKINEVTELISNTNKENIHSQLVRVLYNIQYADSGEKIGIYKYDLINDKYIQLPGGEWIA